MSIKTADGRFTGNPGKSQITSVTANEGVKQTFTFIGYGSRDIFYLASLRVSEANFESRKTYIVNHDSFGKQGSIIELSSHLNLPAHGVSVDFITVYVKDNVVVTLTTNRILTIDFKAIGIRAF